MKSFSSTVFVVGIVLGLVSADTTPGSIATDSNFINGSCIADDSFRTLNGNYTNDIGNTIYSCGEWCYNQGFKYAGVELGGQCFCGNSFQNNATYYPSSSCQSPCAGNANQTCGGSYALNVYQVRATATNTVPTSTPTAETVALGCYSDNSQRVLNGPKNTDFVLLVPQLCADWCFGQGFEYSGVEGAIQCFCGNAIVNGGEPIDSSSCSRRCGGDGSLTCGGRWAINIYRTTPITKTTTTTTTSTSTTVAPCETVEPTSTVAPCETAAPTSTDAPCETAAATSTVAPCETPVATPCETVAPCETAAPTSSVAPCETPVVTPCETVAPCETAVPTHTVAPCETVKPCETAVPTHTVAPCETPVATSTPCATSTPVPTSTPYPGGGSSSSSSSSSVASYSSSTSTASSIYSSATTTTTSSSYSKPTNSVYNSQNGASGVSSGSLFSLAVSAAIGLLAL